MAVMTVRPLEPILHVDLDAFYAGVEVLKDPTLAGKPVDRRRHRCARGRRERLLRGPRASACARRCRRPRAAPVSRRGVRCRRTSRPTALHSNRFREVLALAHPARRADLARRGVPRRRGATRLFGAPVRIATKIRADVAREVGVTCSVGVASTKFVAKLASDHCKPDGLLHVPVEADARRSSSRCRSAGCGGWGRRPRTCSGVWRSARSAISRARRPRSWSGCSARRRRDASHDARARHRRSRRHPVRGTEVGRPRGDLRPRSRRRRRDPARAPAPVGQGRGAPARGRVSGADGDAEGAARRTSRRSRARGRSRTPTDIGADLYHVVAELYRALPGGRSADRLLGVQAVRPAARAAPSNSRCCAASAGATWSARSTGSRTGSAEVLRRRRPCWTVDRPRAAARTDAGTEPRDVPRSAGPSYNRH